MSDQVEKATATDEPREWIFTFGHGQQHFGTFVRIHGTFMSAREEMFRRFDSKWCMQYESEEKAGVEKWNLRELVLP